jgi:S-adenosylmethionine:diacylglycerol 3-amino-3-carboxypropyl transferase
MNKARQSRNRMEKDRIMAGQNHAERRQNHYWPGHKWRGRMILCCHDSVGLLFRRLGQTGVQYGKREPDDAERPL